MWEDVIFDVVLWTTVIVGIWYWKRERWTILALLRDAGILRGPPASLEDPAPRLLEPDVEVVGARILPSPTAGVRLLADVLLRRQAGRGASVLMGLLAHDGEPFAHPGGASWCRFEDGVETLGGTVRTAPAARSFAYWHDQWVEVARRDLPLPDGPASFRIRIEVWIDGRKEASALLHQRFQLGTRSPPDTEEDRCVACLLPGADCPCPHCGELHHRSCLERNRGCTRLACAVRVDPLLPGA